VSTHEEMTEELSERASAFVLGSLPADEAHAYREHVERCATCRTEVAELSALYGDLSLLAPTTEPPPDLWKRVREKMRDPELSSPAESPKPTGVSIVGAHEGEWQEVPIPGIRIRPLHLDKEANRFTFFARLDPGTVYPSHVHGGPEECLVLQGDLMVGDRPMGPGDIQFAEKGSRHEEQTTKIGCLLLLTAPYSDLAELLGS